MMTRYESIELSGGLSGHERVVAAVKHALAEKHYEGRMLPSYRQLAKELDVTMASVLRGMSELESAGFVRRERGRGVFPCVQRPLRRREKLAAIRCVNFVAFAPMRPSFVEADYLTGYTDALEHHDIRMRFVIGDQADFDYDRLLSPAVLPGEQGVILINICSAQLVNRLRRNGVPFVLQRHEPYAARELPPHAGIYVNKSGGAFQAVKHLLDLGHRSIGFMGRVGFDSPTTSLVFEGYRAALLSAGLDCSENNLVHCEATDKPIVLDAAKELLERPQGPTAVLASCDVYALGLMEVARSLNLRVPEDLSIIGFNNQPESALSDPPLATVSVPRRELASSAVELLLEVAKNPHIQPQSRILETHLIVRESIAPPQAARS